MIVEPLFDAQTPLMTLGTWLNQALFQVDERVYSLGDTLKFFANKEAVHVDIDKDEQARDMERVHFGHTSGCTLSMNPEPISRRRAEASYAMRSGNSSGFPEIAPVLGITGRSPAGIRGGPLGRPTLASRKSFTKAV